MDQHPFESRVLIIMTGYVEYPPIQTLFPMVRFALEITDPFLALGSPDLLHGLVPY